MPGIGQPGKVCTDGQFCISEGAPWVRRGRIRAQRGCVTGRSVSGSCSRSLSLIPSSWAGAHQISWLPFIALFLIGIILGEEIAVSHPHLTHSQKDRLTHTPPCGARVPRGWRSLGRQGTSSVLGRGGERGGLCVEEEGNI